MSKRDIVIIAVITVLLAFAAVVTVTNKQGVDINAAVKSGGLKIDR